MGKGYKQSQITGLYVKYPNQPETKIENSSFFEVLVPSKKTF